MEDEKTTAQPESSRPHPSHFGLQPFFALLPLGHIYGALMRARRGLYRKGLLASYDLGVPVLSVGNITTGGTGKTPIVAWAARALAEDGLRVCILTRGYGRRDERKRVLVSDGERLLADAREGGDEPRLLAEMLQGRAAVLCAADRVAAGVWARENLGSEVFVLDDGFQHLRLRRDLDIITIDATNPWGDGRLLPHGRLREPRDALKRAGLIIITRAEQAGDLGSLKREIQSLGGRQDNIFISRTRTKVVRPLSRNETGALSPASSYRVAAFCALGNPQSFFEHLSRNNFSLSHRRAFPDHHIYTQSDVDRIIREAKERGAEALLTTAKDAVKLSQLRFDLPCFVIEIEFEFEKEPALREMLRRFVA